MYTADSLWSSETPKFEREEWRSNDVITSMILRSAKLAATVKHEIAPDITIVIIWLPDT